MPKRAMIVVGGGSSTRFGRDKLLSDVNGLPLIAHTIDAVAASVDRCVVVCRPESIEQIAKVRPGVTVAAGGSTRTLSEMAGLAALGGEFDLIGIHDAARPAVPRDLVERLFSTAAGIGGAVPVIAPERILLDRRTHQPVAGVKRAQTPQVFRGREIMMAYVKAAQAGVDAQDTVEIMQRFADVVIAALPGDPGNIKVTYPDDLRVVAKRLTTRPRI